MLPCTASGSLTAMFADSVRKPLNTLHSMAGAFPAATVTIVSRQRAQRHGETQQAVEARSSSRSAMRRAASSRAPNACARRACRPPSGTAKPITKPTIIALRWM